MTVPNLVFLPDILCDARLFGPQIAELSATCNVMVAPTSLKDRVSDVSKDVLASAPSEFVLVGAGLGGVVAMDILRLAPDRVSHLALAATSPLQECPFDAMAYEPMLVAARAGRFAEAVEMVHPVEALANTETRAPVQALVRDMALALGVEAFAQQVRLMQRRRDAQAVLRKAQCPAAVICGVQDTLIPPKRHEVMAEFMPNCALHILPDAGSMPTLEAAPVTTRILRDLIEGPQEMRPV